MSMLKCAPVHFFRLNDLPLDIIPYILRHLDTRDCCACALVNWAFNHAATPLIYRSIDFRITTKNGYHPCDTIAKNRAYALFVRQLTVSSREGDFLLPSRLTAAELCINLVSAVWHYDGPHSAKAGPHFAKTGPHSAKAEQAFIAFVAVLRRLRVKSITVRTRHDMGEEAYRELTNMENMEKVTLWSLDGPPRVLRGWSKALGSTLTELDLGRCSGVPATLLIGVFTDLPKLRKLRIRGIPSNQIPAVITNLPNLISLDTDFIPSNNYRRCNYVMPPLQQLSIQITSLERSGQGALWTWVPILLSHASLQELSMESFFSATQMILTQTIILGLAQYHGTTLRAVHLNSIPMPLICVECLVNKLPMLEQLGCAVSFQEADELVKVLDASTSLVEASFQMPFTPQSMTAEVKNAVFTLEHAKKLIARPNTKKLRKITVDGLTYVGRWELDTEGKSTFRVICESF